MTSSLPTPVQDLATFSSSALRARKSQELRKAWATTALALTAALVGALLLGTAPVTACIILAIDVTYLSPKLGGYFYQSNRLGAELARREAHL